METIQVELSPFVIERLRREMSADQGLPDVVKEALELWLARHEDARKEREKALSHLRQAGLVLSSERQRTSSEALLSELTRKAPPSREEVQSALKDLAPSLSDEIIRMRGESGWLRIPDDGSETFRTLARQ